MTKAATKALDSNTTEEQDRTTYGQRRINLIWEITQSAIALAVTLSTLYVSARYNSMNATLSNAFFLVIGFYFGRTNHQRVGGVQSPTEQTR